MTKRKSPETTPAAPLVPVEYLLDLMGWKSRSTYYNRLREGEEGIPHLVHTGIRKVALLKSECDAYQRMVIERGRAAPESAPTDGAGASA